MVKKKDIGIIRIFVNFSQILMLDAWVRFGFYLFRCFFFCPGVGVSGDGDLKDKKQSMNLIFLVNAEGL